MYCKQEAAHHVITRWLKRQISQERAFSDLLSALKESGMNHIVVGVAQLKEGDIRVEGKIF